MMISPIVSSETSLMLFSPALASAFAHHGSEAMSSPKGLEHGIEHLKGHIHAAIEQIKYEAEEVLFSRRNDEENDDDEGITNAMDAAYALDYVRSEMLEDGGTAIAAQANVSPGVGAQLLFS